MEGDYQLDVMIFGGPAMVLIAYVAVLIVVLVHATANAGLTSATRWRERRRAKRGKHLPRAMSKPPRSPRSLPG